MSLDLAPVRAAIQDVLETITTIKTVYDFEKREQTIPEMPVAMLWRDEITPSDAGNEFGSITREVTWKIRVFYPLADDADTQALDDTISVALTEAFNQYALLEISGTPLVDQAVTTTIQSDPIFDTTPPLMMTEATLGTVITWAP